MLSLRLPNVDLLIVHTIQCGLHGLLVVSPAALVSSHVAVSATMELPVSTVLAMNSIQLNAMQLKRDSLLGLTGLNVLLAVVVAS